MIFFKKTSILTLLVFMLNSCFPSAIAGEITLCAHKSTRVVTYPKNATCSSNQLVLKVATNEKLSSNTKVHTTTAQIAPKQPEKVYIPNVYALSEIKAKEALASLNLRVQVKLLKKSGGIVVQVIPKPGSLVNKGSVVTIVVG